MRRRKQLSVLGVATVIAAIALGATPATAAITPTLTDRDGDGIPDIWEEEGVDTDGDGIIDLDLPAMGADPDRADVFVELDYMPGLLPSIAELDTITQTFADMPIQNPDGSTGITLHLDAGPAGGPDYDLGGGNEVPYEANIAGVSEVSSLRQTQSDPARDNVFHYALFADYYGNGGSSGQAWINGLELLVSVGDTYWGEASSAIRVGTFVHELGHNLGLLHGGHDNVNYKPNYLSVMNYAYQLSGVPRTDGSSYFGFSTTAQPTLDERSLNERVGLGPSAAGYDIFWWTGNTRNQAPANGPIDFNRNGTINQTNVSVDINRGQGLTQLVARSDLDLFALDVGRKGEPYGGAGLGPQLPEVLEYESNELTAEVARELQIID